MFKALGSTIQMSMSSDDTCRGLRSADDGPITLQLTEGKISQSHSHEMWSKIWGTNVYSYSIKDGWFVVSIYAPIY